MSAEELQRWYEIVARVFMKLRIQYKSKKHAVDISDDANLAQLIDLIESTINEPKFSIKSGFPPKPLDIVDPLISLRDAGIKSGETLIVEAASDTKGEQATSSTSFRASKVIEPSRTDAQPASVPQVRKKEVLQDTFSFGGSSIKNTATPQESDATLPPEVHVPQRGILTLRVQPDDNSCLFRAVGYLCMRSTDAMAELRQIIATTIQENPEEYSDAVLGMKRDAYCTKMNRADTWGGEIEMKILSDYFNVQIASIDCKTGHVYRYGEVRTECIYIVYSGIHYDALALSPAENAPPDWDQTQFSSADAVIEKAAIDLVAVLRKRNYFTDTATFDLRCNDCAAGLVGEKGAQEHAMKTGHVNFGEYRA